MTRIWLPRAAVLALVLAPLGCCHHNTCARPPAPAAGCCPPPGGGPLLGPPNPPVPTATAFAAPAFP
jgi:hypothetical protein